MTIMGNMCAEMKEKMTFCAGSVVENPHKDLHIPEFPLTHTHKQGLARQYTDYFLNRNRLRVNPEHIFHVVWQEPCGAARHIHALWRLPLPVLRNCCINPQQNDI